MRITSPSGSMMVNEGNVGGFGNGGQELSSDGVDILVVVSVVREWNEEEYVF